MNSEADSGTATVSEIHNQTHFCKEILAFGQSRLDPIASLLPQRFIASAYLGNKKQFIRDRFISLVYTRRTGFRTGASSALPNEGGEGRRIWRARFGSGLEPKP